MQVSSRNFFIFKTAQATAISRGQEIVVKGFRFPFMRGRYSVLLVENIWYGDAPIPKEARGMIEAVRNCLGDKKAPKKVPIRQTPG